MPITLPYATYLRTHRDQWRLSQSELGILLGVSGSAISKYERLTRIPSIDVLIGSAFVFGEDVQRISGEEVFRALHGFRRLVLMNLGLSETQRKPVRYSMFMGSDIADQLDTLPGNRSRTKTNLFGQGFIDVEDFDDNDNVVGTWPQKSTIGCSTKGKIWSYQSTNSFAEWIEWCRSLGRRLLNSSITNEQFWTLDTPK